MLYVCFFFSFPFVSVQSQGFLIEVVLCTCDECHVFRRKTTLWEFYLIPLPARSLLLSSMPHYQEYMSGAAAHYVDICMVNVFFSSFCVA
jgi:hypothetical protein